MAIIVEHDKRKHEILQKSIELFSKEGYEDVTFQKIADACGITRTTLYIYFKNKREIFSASIKQMTSEIEMELLTILKNKTLNSKQCLSQVVTSIVKSCKEHKALLQVLLMYLISLQKSGADPEERIHRRVIRAEHLLSMIIISGQKNGEFKETPIKDVKDMFFKLFEATIFEIVLYNNNDIERLTAPYVLAIEGISNK